MTATGNRLQPGDLLTSAQVAELCGVQEPTVRYWRHRGRGPDWFTLATGDSNPPVRYRREDVESWIGQAQHAARNRQQDHRRRLRRVA